LHIPGTGIEVDDWSLLATVEQGHPKYQSTPLLSLTIFSFLFTILPIVIKPFAHSFPFILPLKII
jgi:hypothetical protein